MDPHQLDIARERVRLHLSQSRYDAAMHEVEQALASAPDDPELQRLRAVTLLDSGRAQQALEALNHALATEPEDPTLHLLASMALTRLGHHGDAVAAASEAARLAPFEPEPHRQLARAHAASGPHGSAPARAAAARSLELAPREADSHLAMVDAIFPDGARPGRRDREVAEHHVRQALDLEPESPAALNELARIQMAGRRSAQAAGTLSRAVAGSPQEQLFHHNMDVALANNVVMAHWALFLAVFVIIRVDALSERAQMAVIAGIALLALGFIVGRLLTQVRQSRMAYLRGFARRQTLIAVWAALLGLSVLSFVLGALTGLTAFLGLGIAGLFLGALLSWVAWFRNRKS